MEGNDKDEQTAGGEADEAVYAEGIDGALRKKHRGERWKHIFRTKASWESLRYYLFMNSVFRIRHQMVFSSLCIKSFVRTFSSFLQQYLRTKERSYFLVL